MKMKNRIIIGMLFVIILMWSCERNNSSLDTVTLKQSINQSAADLNTAMEIIGTSKAFSLLTVSESGAKSVSGDSIYRVYIGLDQVKGVYDYNPVTTFERGISLIKYFTKTADSNYMVVKMPLKKIERPGSLRHYEEADSVLTNNFSIAVSEYHNNYNSFRDFDYILASQISIDDAVAGALNIEYVVSPAAGTDYKSQYTFTDGYSAKYKYLSGDTTVSGFGIFKDDAMLYEEKRQTVRNDTAKFGREHMYTLTIGDVQIVRKSGIVAPAIYVNGVLQTNAMVEIVDKAVDPEATVCKKRDIRITFDDGTVTTVSAMIGESVENIKVLFESLHNVYFAAYIVDWIAYDIYYQR
ncbi:MAG: hypothetical protein A2X03_15915 [Bacteroidetes bacterium GWA2_40_15]|nr:MAG: hypothetical protein A2X03_15915 [Bacteroidetes bacterium GWA2_40_15]HBQ82875.1 hypothetical protein [Bacteroidales bacterium]